MLCQKCKYPETTMFIKQKKLMSKCRACGNESQLDDTHRAGTQLMKNLPKDMSEIDSKKASTTEEKKTEETKDGKTVKEDGEGSGEEDKKEKKKKKKKDGAAEEEEEQPVEEEGIKLDSEEIGKFYCPSQTHSLNDEYLVTTTDILNDYNWFCNSDNFHFELNINLMSNIMI